jgi:LSD1 subclass zinc finger protein
VKVEPEPEAPEPKRKQRMEPAPPRPRKEKSDPEQPATPGPGPAPSQVTCRNCSRKTLPLSAGAGRVRCEHCQSVFPAGAIDKPVDRKKEPATPFLERWKKPLTVAATLAAILLVAAFGSRLFGSSRVRVYRAHGKAEYEGKPMANATIMLHPLDKKRKPFPLPCASVKEDGTYVLNTYGKGDGAPVGEYKITVEWVMPVGNNSIPVNVLSAKYKSVATSDLTVKIKSGENVIPPLRFTKSGLK